MVKKILKLLAVVLMLLLSAAYLRFHFLGKELDIESVKPYFTQSIEDKNDKMELTYLGCAGFVINYHDKGILCDPYISNPGIFNFGKKHTPWKDKVAETTLKSIDMVTISHGHYDHCYDIKDLCNYLQPESKIIADISVQYQLNSIYTNKTFQNIGLHYQEQQQWIYNQDSTFRVYPLQSIHNPHIGKMEFFKGKYSAPLNQLPERAWQWPKGEDYSYLIDILDNDTSIAYRIVLVNGNLNTEGMSALKNLSNQRHSDLQLQIFWKEELVKENMMNVYGVAKPEKVILHHWNNFFVSFDEPLQYLRDSHLPEVLKEYNNKGIPVSMMLPFTSVKL